MRSTDPLYVPEEPLVCSHCGSSRVSLVQRGIDNLLIGKCAFCSAREPVMPDASDTSAKAEKLRRRIMMSQTTRYKASLVPVVPASQFRPKAKVAQAKPASLWDDTLT